MAIIDRSAPGFGVELETLTDRVVVSVQGEIDATVAAQLEAAFLTAVERGRLEVDLARTTFIDSSGLAALVAAYHALGQTREAVVVTHAAPGVRAALAVTGIDDVIDLRD